MFAFGNMESNAQPKPISDDYLQKLVAADEKRRTFIRGYMRQYRAEHREQVNAYKRELYKKKKEQLNVEQHK